MKDRLREYIHKYDLIEQGDIVSVGLSGGADSVCLFLLLSELKEEMGFSLKAFHVDHKLRGKASDDDRRFVIELCEKNSVPLQVFEHDIALISSEMKKGYEETGRLLRRRDALLCLENGCTTIALAHHMNDQAETFLFNAARGCSLDGITGIKPKMGPFIHPLLSFSKEEILEELKKRGQNWCTDQSNEDTHYTRNHIRQVLIPEMLKINPQAVTHIFELTEDLSQVQSVLKDLTDRSFEQYVEKTFKGLFIKEEIGSEPSFLIRSVIKRVMEELAGSKRDISRVHMEDVEALLGKETGKETDLPYEMKAVRLTDGILIKKKIKDEYCIPEIPFVPGEIIVVNGLKIGSEFIEDANEYIQQKNKYTKCFDYDKISKNCVFRARKAGDRLVINSQGETKKLKDYLIESKIPRDDRDRLLVFAKNQLVYWVVGLRMGENAKVTENTTRILKISISGGYTDEFPDQ